MSGFLTKILLSGNNGGESRLLVQISALLGFAQIDFERLCRLIRR